MFWKRRFGMIKPTEHNCMACGNVYYFRGVKLETLCPVCRGDLMPKGYEYRRWAFGGGIISKMPIIPAPPLPPKRAEECQSVNPPKPVPLSEVNQT